MENEILLGKQKIRFDHEATVALYRKLITVAGADDCSCRSCMNFAAQRSQAYPEEFLRLLNEIGADPRKEWEAFDYDIETGPYRHLYGGWFLFSGEIIEECDKRPEPKPFSYWFTTSFPKGSLSDEVKACAIEFCAEIPWILTKN